MNKDLSLDPQHTKLIPEDLRLLLQLYQQACFAQGHKVHKHAVNDSNVLS